MEGAVFLTGGSGFVGSALVRRLVSQGRMVRALARSDESAAELAGTGATVVRGDLFDHEALLEGMRGCASVFHVAGVNAMCVKDPAPMMRTNVDGSAAIVRAAAAARIARLVYTSSATTIGERMHEIGHERTQHRGSFNSDYERSKVLGERRVIAVGESLGVPVVSVNPSSVQGPGRLRGSARLLIDIVNGRLPVLVDTWLSVVDIEDCTAAHLLAEQHGVPGSRYIVSGASLEVRTAVSLLRRASGHPRRVWFAPRIVATAGGAVVGAGSRILGREGGRVCSETVRTLLHGHRFDASLAERELGLAYTPIETTIRRTLAWYAEQGLAPAPIG
ncbi:MAG TPA: NAD-dependent epimerase/dehydratase family protein [Actinomycetota bacterium]|nr:NAD-dependent epimerase/dehydratase family protein [Actinomycetota bacterium]